MLHWFVWGQSCWGFKVKDVGDYASNTDFYWHWGEMALGGCYTHLMMAEDEETINAYLSIMEYQNIEI